MASKYFKAFNLFKSKVSPTITSVKPSTKLTLEGQKKIIKSKTASEVQKKFGGVSDKIMNETRQLRQTMQGMRGERITQSGISKGKDVTPGIYPKKKVENKAKGGRAGYKMGTNPFKRKTNVDKIKETFGPKPKKELSPKQMKIAKLAGNKNQIDAADFAKLRRS